jgi:L-arabinokinase
LVVKQRPIHILWYLTAHGYGHGVRSTAVMQALRRECPGVRLTVVSALPEDFLRDRLRGYPDGALAFRRAAFDVGLVQLDSVRADIPATLEKVTGLLVRRPALIDEEAAWQRTAAADIVVADIPAIPLAAAARSGLPRVAIGNFSWDWIYAPYAETAPRWRPAVDAFRADYASTDVLLQYPLSPDMSGTFQRRLDIPLPSSPGRPRRAELASRTGADPSRRWILLSFTTLDWSDSALARVAAIRGTEFFTVRPLEWTGIPNIHAVERTEFPFSDIVATVDAVLSKPGFGILADCAANGKPLVYADRENFAEYPVLERAIQQHLAHVHIPAADLYAGHLAPSLDALASAPPPPRPLPLGGDTAAAREILRRAGR